VAKSYFHTGPVFISGRLQDEQIDDEFFEGLAIWRVPKPTLMECPTFYVLGSDEKEPVIFMDLQTRNFFGLKKEDDAEFKYELAGSFWGTLFWSLKNTNPGLRIASQLGLIGLLLGIISLILGVISLFHH
jgi:hypothetical protein